MGEAWNATDMGGPVIATFENQRYRASGPNLIVATITRWNTVYLERAVAACVSTASLSTVNLCPLVTHRLGTHHSDRRF